jgi:hypothetical protein
MAADPSTVGSKLLNDVVVERLERLGVVESV